MTQPWTLTLPSDDAGRPPWALGIDIGTSSVKAIVFDALGQAVPGLRAQTAHSPFSDAAGASEFSPEDLVSTVAQTIDAVMDRARKRRARIAAVGCCCFWHSMVGVDAHGAPVGPIYTWADRRPAGVVADLQTRTDTRALHRRTGCPLHASYFPARLAWLRTARPHELARAVQWLSPAEYLYARLFGRPSLSISMASATGLLDQDRCEWDPEALALAGIDRCALAPLDEADEPVRGLKPEWAERWPELAGIPWARAIGDGAASNIGSGCLTPERAAINLGTSGAIRVAYADERNPDIPGLWRYRIDRDRRLIGAAFSDGGNVADWCATVLAPDDGESRARDAHGLTVLPFLGGERSIGWRPGATATIHGLALHTDARDIRQAFREAVALRFALVFDRLRAAFHELTGVTLSGGAPARSPEWRSLLADALGVSVLACAEPEASCRGAALVGAAAAGLIDLEHAAAIAGDEVAPDPQGHAALRAALDRQERLYARMEAPL